MFFSIGCLIYFLPVTELPLYPSLITLVGSICCILYLRWRRVDVYVLYYLFWAVFWISLGFSLSWYQSYRHYPFYQVPLHATQIEGIVQGVDFSPSGKKRIFVTSVKFLLPPESDQMVWPRKIIFTLRAKDQQNVDVGNRIRAKVMLRRPSSPQIIGAYDQQFHSWFGNVGAYGYALRQITIINSKKYYHLRYVREKIAEKVHRVLPGREGDIAQILLTGLGGQLSPQDRHIFSASGLAHLLAIAGLHLGTVMFIVAYTSRWLLLRSQYATLCWPIKHIAVLCGWFAGCLYLMLTGMHIPALRSLIMASTAMVAFFYNRSCFSRYNLMLASMVLLLWSPVNVLDISFQMSMAAVLSLTSGYRYALRYLKSHFLHDQKKYPYIFRFVVEPALISLIAGSAVLPIVAFYFHELNSYYVVANLIAVPIAVLWVLPFGIIALLTMPVGGDVIFLKLMAWGIHAIIFIAQTVANLPYASLPIVQLPHWGLGCYFLGLFLLCVGVLSFTRWLGIVLIFISLCSYFLINLPDAITTPNGRMIGIRHKKDVWVVCQGVCNKMVLEQWRKALGVQKTTVIQADNSTPYYHCEKKYCYFYEEKILVVRQAISENEEKKTLCSNVVTELSFLWEFSECKTKHFINKKSNWTKGAHTLWLNPYSSTDDLHKRGQRPWVMEPIDRGSPNMPMARSEYFRQ